MELPPHVNILGTRGVPAAHGGFETFAQRLALYLVSQGVGVTVYCQTYDKHVAQGHRDSWNGVERVFFRPKRHGPAGTIEFDLAATKHVLGQPGVDLVLGYNTAIFTVLQRIAGRRVFMNMDGIEWRRQKWSWPARQWLKVNEWLGAKLANVPIADHPQIAAHILQRTGRHAVMIPYGAPEVDHASEAVLEEYGLFSDDYFISVARPEPENSLLELVRAHQMSQSAKKLMVLGNIMPANPYHRKLLEYASPSVIFPGGIYDPAKLRALRFHARAYFHGHQVGGTNPSLVEALGAGNAVIAHDNRFNRWTAGPEQFYFKSVKQCAAHLARLSVDELAVRRARNHARAQHQLHFTWDAVLSKYQMIMLGKSGPTRVRRAPSQKPQTGAANGKPSFIRPV